MRKVNGMLMDAMRMCFPMRMLFAMPCAARLCL